MPTRFIFPICAINAAQVSERTSSTPPDEYSLSKNEPELGDSDGVRRRIEIVPGTKLVVNVKRCISGLRADGTEWVKVGHSVVGGSYLVPFQRSKST